RRVDLAADEPLGERRVPVKDLVPGFKPVDRRAGLLAPEPLGVVPGPFPEGLVLLQARDVRGLGEVGRRGEDPALVEDAGDRSLPWLSRHVAGLAVRTGRGGRRWR